MGLHVASAVSEHPIPAHAVGACLGEVLEAGGPGPVAVVVAVTEALVGALEDVVGATRQLLGPEALLAVTVSGVLGGAREVDGRGAVMMFAVWDPDGHGPPVRPVRLASAATPGDSRLGGSDVDGLDGLRGAEGTLVLFSDPFSVAGAALLDDLQLVAPALRVVGGELSAARHAGGNRLVLDASAWTDGAVGLWFGPDAAPLPLLSRAARGLRRADDGHRGGRVGGWRRRHGRDGVGGSARQGAARRGAHRAVARGPDARRRGSLPGRRARRG